MSEIHIHIHTGNGGFVQKETYTTEDAAKVAEKVSDPLDMDSSDSVTTALKNIMINGAIPGGINESTLASLKLMYYMLSGAFGQRRSDEDLVKVHEESVDEAIRRSFSKKTK